MSGLIITEIPMPESKFKINDTVKFADIGIYRNYIFKVAGIKQNDIDETFGYRYDLDNTTQGTKPLRLNNIPEGNLIFLEEEKEKEKMKFKINEIVKFDPEKFKEDDDKKYRVIAQYLGWGGNNIYRYDIVNINDINDGYYGVNEDHLVSAGARLEEPETASEEPQGQVPADFDIIQLRNGIFYQYFKSMDGFIKITNDKDAYNFLGGDHITLEGLDYIDSFGIRDSNFDIMKIYRGIATDRVLTASASELKKYEVWSRPEPYVIPEKLIKTALKDFVGFEEEDIKVDEKNRFYIDGAIVGDSAKKFIENEEWKKKETETESLWSF